MKQEPLVYVAFGDSITFAVGKFGVTNETSFRGIAARRIEEALARPVKAHNAGVGGDITTQAVARVDHAVLQRSPDLVTVMFGVNDAGFYRPDTDAFADTPRVPLPEFRRALSQIVGRIKDGGPAVVVLTPLPMNRHYWGVDYKPYVENGLNYLVEQYAQTARDVAQELGAPLADTYAHFAADPETVDMVPDGIHPNPDGHRVIADLLAPVALAAIGEE